MRRAAVATARWYPMIAFMCAAFCLFAVSVACAVEEEEKQIPRDKKVLEARVQELVTGDNVTLRSDVALLYALIDIYVKDGELEKALPLYDAALQADGWNLERQLAYARLLKDLNEPVIARDKAQFVYDYAEDESMIEAARTFIAETGGAVAQDGDVKNEGRSGKFEIVIAPIGEANKALLREILPLAEGKTGIHYGMSNDILDPGPYDRTDAERYINGLFERVKATLPAAVAAKILEEKGISPKELQTVAGKKRFLETAYIETGAPRDAIDQFYENLKQMSQTGQYNADRLLSLVEKHFPGKVAGPVKGLMGVTASDIFAKDYNYLFGWAHKGTGIVSYHRFRASFNDEPPDRGRLRNRLVKQVVSSTFFILGIPRCTSPACMRAYPHNLQEHDQKNSELCRSCRKKLDEYIKNPR